jgi:hypothetical protein
MTRDLRIDMLRGLALVMIFVNHVPGTIWENLTSRNFGFSDAAEGFVLLSGVSAGLAYGRLYSSGQPLSARLRPVRRSITIWGVHLLVTFGCIVVALAGLRYLGTGILASSHNLSPLFDDPLGTLPGLLTLGHQLGYTNVLPMYVVLLMATPFLLFLALRWPRLLMAASLALWAAAGLWKLNLPNAPLPGGWYFNPLSWQVLFVAGLLTGLALREGRRILPARRWALVLAWGFIVLSAIWVRVPAIGETGGHLLWTLHEYGGVPGFFVGFDKTYLSPPRLLHFLALAYVLSSLPALRRLAGNRAVAPLVTLGRHSLPVFATGTVLAYAAQAVKEAAGPSVAVDTVLIFGALALLYALARWREGSAAGGGRSATPPLGSRTA